MLKYTTELVTEVLMIQWPPKCIDASLVSFNCGEPKYSRQGILSVGLVKQEGWSIYRMITLWWTNITIENDHL